MHQTLALAFLSSVLAASTLHAQGPARAGAGDEQHSLSGPLVTAVASRDQVRFTALALTRAIQLEVRSSTGEPVYDSGRRPGNRLEWPVADQQGLGLQDGTYGCLVTVTDLQGQVSYRRAIFRVKEGIAVILDAENGVAPAAASDEQESLTVLRADNAAPFTLISHDGREGWIESASGGLSFYAGSLSRSGDGVPQLRLTPDGNLGIGVAEPAAKLDVAGLIRASEGFQFSDGTILKIDGGLPVLVSGESLGAASGATGSPSRTTPADRAAKTTRILAAGGGITRVSASAGTAGRIAKFVNQTDLGDSVMTESGGYIGIGTTAPISHFNVASSSNVSPRGFTNEQYNNGMDGVQFRARKARGTPAAPAAVQSGDVLGNYVFDAHDGAAFFTGVQIRPVAEESWSPTAHGAYLALWTTPPGTTTNTEKMRITGAGNVGIGTTTPTSKLTVDGNVEVKGAGNGILFSDGSVLTSSSAARIRAITYLAGCDTCGALTDADDQRTIFVNLIGPMTVNSVTCFSDAGSPVINVQRDSGTPANILSGDLTCSTTGSLSTAIAQSTLNLNDQVHFVMVSAGGAAKRVTVIIKATVN